MKLGKTKLKRMLSEETGIPPQDIADFGKYEYYGNKEQLFHIWTRHMAGIMQAVGAT